MLNNVTTLCACSRADWLTLFKTKINFYCLLLLLTLLSQHIHTQQQDLARAKYRSVLVGPRWTLNMQVINTDLKNGATVDLNFQQNPLSKINPDQRDFAEHIWYFKTSCDTGGIDDSHCQLHDQRCQTCSALVGTGEIYGHAAIWSEMFCTSFVSVIPLLQRHFMWLSGKYCRVAVSRPVKQCSGLLSSIEISESTVPYPCS